MRTLLTEEEKVKRRKNYMTKYRHENKEAIQKSKNKYRVNNPEKDIAYEKTRKIANLKTIEKSKFANVHMTKWSDDDIETLIQMREANISHAIIADKLNRTIKSCRSILYTRKRKEENLRSKK